MKKNKVKKNKFKTIIVIILIILILGLTSYFIYNKFFSIKEVIKQEKDIVTLDNDFYNIDYLVVNKYISLINKSDQLKYNTNEQINPYMIKITNNKVLVANNLALEDKDIKLIPSKGIEGTPKIVKYLSYQNNYVFFVLTKENDLYYANTSSNNDSIIVNNFKKINTDKIVNIYEFYTDDNISYPWFPLTIYAENENGDLLNVNSGKITTSFKEDYPLPDQICGGWSNKDSCVGLYISPDKNLYLIQDKEKKLYQEILYKGKTISVKDAFSLTKIKSTKDGNAKLDKITYYIIGKDNYLYEVMENNSYKIISIKKYNNNEIISYEYKNDDNNYIVSINYKNGDKDYFKDVSVFSSLYYRYNS